MVAFNLIRSKRRTMAIEIHAHEVRVRAPTWTSRREINAFVESRADWIAKHLAAQQVAVPPPVRHFNHGDTLLYLGNEIRLARRAGRGKAEFDAENQTLCVAIAESSPTAMAAPLPPKGENLDLFAYQRCDEGIAMAPPQVTKIRKKIADWYKAQALTYTTQRSEYYAAHMGVHYTAIRVAEFKRQWGSCAARGVISYNWLLMMAPPWIIDYIVVHELAHLRHHNHGARFWAMVEKFFPRSDEARKWLRTHHAELRL